MAKKKPAKASTPRSFNGVIKDRDKPVRDLAKAIRALVLEELPDAEESYYGGRMPMAMYRATGDVCWIQPLKSRCNLYLLRGRELTDPGGLLEGQSDRAKHVKIQSIDHLDQLPIREWLRETIELNEAAIAGGMSFEEVHEKLRGICLALPQTKETMTWGKPHFRVKEKIFCGCGEQHGRPSLGLKMEPNESIVLMKLPGVEKAPYSRPKDGWVQIFPNDFDDWVEIERLIVGSYRLIAPKRVAALLDEAP